MSVLPVAFSLMASFMSAITLLGVTQVYLYIFVSVCLSACLSVCLSLFFSLWSASYLLSHSWELLRYISLSLSLFVCLPACLSLSSVYGQLYVCFHTPGSYSGISLCFCPCFCLCFCSCFCLCACLSIFICLTLLNMSVLPVAFNLIASFMSVQVHLSVFALSVFLFPSLAL